MPLSLNQYTSDDALGFSKKLRKHPVLEDDTGAPSGGVPQKRCSAAHIQLAGKFFIASGLCWEILTFPSISSRAGWEILTFPLAFQSEQKELAEGTLETDDD